MAGASPQPTPAPDGTAARFDVRLEQRGGQLLIRMEGELDAEAAPALRAEIASWPIVAATTVDLGGVTFVDSTGIGCLLKLHQRVSDAGGVLVVRGPVAAVRRTLEVTGLHRVLAILG